MNRALAILVAVAALEAAAVGQTPIQPPPRPPPPLQVTPRPGFPGGLQQPPFTPSTSTILRGPFLTNLPRAQVPTNIAPMTNLPGLTPATDVFAINPTLPGRLFHLERHEVLRTAVRV